MAMTTLMNDARSAKVDRTSAKVLDDAASTAGDWTMDPRARRLLISCAKNPPAGRYHHVRYVRSQECHYAYSGYRAEALAVIRTEYATRAMAACQAGDDAAWDAFSAQPTVTAAIDAAPIALRYAEATISIRRAIAASFDMAEAA